MGSIGLVPPMEDGDIATGNTEAMDVLQGEWGAGSNRSAVPVGEALRPAGLDGGFEIGCFDGIDVDGAELVGLLAEDGEGGLVHERR